MFKRINYIYFLVMILCMNSFYAQSKLKIIRAGSKNVSIRDGEFFDKDAWTLSPESKPDIFTDDRTRKIKWVTFYTDLDSIRITVTPGSSYSFIILLNEKDSCYTKIVSAIAAENKTAVEAHDTIPFTLTSFNAIKIRSIINNTDTLNLHFDVGSFDFRLTKEAILTKTKLMSNRADVLAGKIKPDYNHLNKISELKMGNLVWNDPLIIPTSLTAREMDGRFGWNLFEGKKVEINYDLNLLIIHSMLPKNLKGYVKSKLEFIRSFVCIRASLEIENKNYTGSFLLDTGSDQAIILDSAWVARQNFLKKLEVLKSSVLRDPRGVKYESKIVLSPAFKINSFELARIPTYILGSRNPTLLEVNYLGNDLLKRFNMILDFEKDEIYLKPNKLANAKYREGA